MSDFADRRQANAADSGNRIEQFGVSGSTAISGSRIDFADGGRRQGSGAEPTTVIRPGTTEVVFIEGSLPDYQTLAGDVRAGVQVIQINGPDAFAQMAADLAGVTGLTAINLVSHGSDGQIQFGTTILDSQSLPSYAADLAAIGASSAPGGDLLIYGCDVAQDAAGQAFVQAIASATGANVAASTQLVGATATGDNWTLDYQTGPITAAPAISDASGANYAYDLVSSAVVVTAGPQGPLFFSPDTTTYPFEVNTNGYAGTITEIGFDTAYGAVNGTLEYSSNGTTWTNYTLTNTVGQLLPITDEFRYTNTSTSTTQTGLGLGVEEVENGQGNYTEFFLNEDLPPTAIVTNSNVVLNDAATGSAVATLYPVDTGDTTGGVWVLDSQSQAGLFSLSDNTSDGNTATVVYNSGSLPAVGSSATLMATYYDIYQLNSDGTPMSGSGVTQTFTFTTEADSTTSLTGFGNNIVAYSGSVDPSAGVSDAVGSPVKPVITTLTNGDLVAVWTEASGYATGDEIFGQIYTAGGATVGGAFQISPSASTSNVYAAPAVTALANGAFAVAYLDADPTFTNPSTIDYNVVSSSGVVGSVQTVSGATTSAYDLIAPAIATLSTGQFIIGWSTNPDSSYNSSIDGQTFSASGTASGSTPISISTGTGAYYAPSITALANGHYATAWADEDTGDVDQTVDGGSQSAVFAGTSSVVAESANPVSVATLSNGNYVTVWNEDNYNTGTSNIYAEIYNSSGQSQGAAFLVDTATTDFADNPTVAALSNGGFVVTWKAFDDSSALASVSASTYGTLDSGDPTAGDFGGADGMGIFGRRYSSSGTAIDATPFQVNQYSANNQDSPDVVGTSNGGFAAIWINNSIPEGTTPSASGVDLRILTTSPTIDSATYNASTGVLAVTGVNFTTTATDFQSTDLTLTGEGGITYTLTGGTVSGNTSTSFNVTLTAADQLAVAGLLNKAGLTSNTSGTAYDLAATAAFDTGGAVSTAAVTVSSPVTPAISSVSFNAATGVLTLNGTFDNEGATGGLNLHDLTIKGEGGTSYALATTASPVTVTPTTATITLTGADLAKAQSFFDKNGASAADGVTYNIASAAGWDSGAGAAIATLGVAVSGIVAPSQTVATIAISADTGESATDFVTNTAAQTVSGTLSAALAPYDGVEISVNGGTTWTQASVTGTSYAASVILASGAGTIEAEVYNATGASTAKTQSYTLDTTPPTLATATVDATSLVLTYTETGSGIYGGESPAASEYSVKVGGVTDAVTSAVLNAAANTVTLALATSVPSAQAVTVSYTPDGVAAQELQDVAGNLAAALTNQTVTDNTAPPAISSVSYDASTGALVVTGANFTTSAGDYAPTDLTLKGEGGNSYTLTGGVVSNVSSSGFTVTLTAADQLAVDGLLNKTGLTSNTSGTAYNLAAAAGYDTGAGTVTTQSVTVNNPVAPAVSAVSFDAASGVLTLNGTFDNEGGVGGLSLADLTITGQGGTSYALATTASPITVTATTATITLTGADLTKAQSFFDKNGVSAVDGAAYNIALAAGWDSGTGAAIATQGVTVSGITAPSQTVATIAISADTGESATDFITNTAAQTVSGTLSAALAPYDGVQVSVDGGATWVQASVTGASYSASVTLGAGAGPLEAEVYNAAGASTAKTQSYTLDTTAPALDTATVDATSLVLTYTETGSGIYGGDSPTTGEYSVQLGGVTDTVTSAILNAAAHTETLTLATAVTSAQTVTVSYTPNGTAAQELQDVAGNLATALTNQAVTNNTPPPAISSVSYDASIGALVVTGTNFTTSAGDYTPTDLTLTGEGGTSYTLTGGAVSNLSGSGFTVTLTAADQLAVDGLLNAAGLTSNTSGTAYNLDAAAGYDTDAGAVTAQSVTVSNPIAPAISTVSFDAATGVLTLNGTFDNEGATGGLNLADLTITGEGGSSYALATTASPVTVTATTATIALTGADLAEAQSLFDKNGASAVDGAAYNIALAAGWDSGAGAAITTQSVAVSDIVPPVVTTANISVASGTGTGGAFKIGDTVTATWNDSASGDNNNTPISGVTFDFSQFGGAAVVATDVSNVWTATYTVTGGSINTSVAYVAVTATDSAGPTTTNGAANVTVDDEQPLVTAGNIGLSGGTGVGGAFKIGDTVTATWNDSATGDNNTDAIAGVTANFSQFGGGAAVAASDSGGVWTATYTIAAGSIDTAAAQVAVTATDHVGNATTTTSGAVTVDDEQPVVTAGNIGLSGGSGVGGAFKIGDTVTATWNDSATGDNNTDAIAGVTANFSQFGGGAAVVASESGGVWTATYTIAVGNIDTASAQVAMTVTDTAGNATTTAGAAVTVDDEQPAVTAGNISLSGGTGVGGAFKIGDTVTATWNDSVTGDDNSDAIAGVTADFSQFGGGVAVAASESGGVWTATYTIAAGAIDTAVAQVAVTATDVVGNATTTASGAVTVDDKQPVVTAANIGVTGGSGPGGAFKIGDVVTATWNDTATGDNNSDAINPGGVTFDFSQFGGGSAVVATDSGGVWTATYTIAAGNLDTTTAQFSATATDHAGNATTTSGASNITVDDKRLIVTAANIGMSGGSGPGGALKIGDTVTATWNDSATGDDNSDAIAGVTFDFAQFGGGSAVAASDNGGVWTANYTITAGGIDTSSAKVAATATDAVGNATTTSGASNVTVDDEQPVATAANIGVTGGSGPGGAFKIGDVVTASWNNSAGGDDNSDAIAGVTFDFSQLGGGSAVTASENGGVWTATYTIAAGDIDTTSAHVALTATDTAGNATTAAGASNVAVDDVQPTVASTTIVVSGGTGAGGAFETGDTVTASWDDSSVDAAAPAIWSGGSTSEDNPDPITSVTFDFSQFGGGSVVVASDSGGVWTASYLITEGDIDTTSAHVGLTATDAAGNTITIGGGPVAIDDTTVAPTITGVVAGRTTTSEAALNPFANVTIGDANPGATETLTITLSGSGGTLAGSGLTGGSGGYTLSGTAAAVTAELDALSFTPTAGQPGTSGTTTFTLADASSAFATPTVNAATTVTDVDPSGTGWGDVHMVTFQGLHYDFQAVGDFTLAKGTTAADPFDVQIQTSAWASMVSVTTEIAAQVGGNAVQFDLDGDVLVNGAVDTSLGSVGAAQALDGGAITRTSADSYVVDWASGESLAVTNVGSYFNESVTLSAKDGPGSVQGLLGSNTSQATDIQLADGTVLDAPTDSQLLGVYAQSWSVADSASLLNDNTSLPLAMSNDGDAATPFNGRSFIDLAGVNPASATLGFREDASGAFGTLSVQSGSQQTSMTLLGQYAAAGFGVASDGHGGTIVDYTPPKVALLG